MNTHVRSGLSARDRNFFLTAEDLAFRRMPASPAGVAAELQACFGRKDPAPGRIAATLASQGLLKEARGRPALVPTRKGTRTVETAVEEYFSDEGLASSAESPAFRAL